MQILRGKVAALAAAGAALSLLLAGCTGQPQPSQTPEPSQATPSESPAPSEPAGENLADLVPAKIKERGYVIVATDAQWGAPTNFNPGGDTTKWDGIEHDLIKAMEPILGVEFRQEAAAFTSIITGVSGGRYDLGVSGFQDKIERQQVVDMINYMGGGGSQLIVKAGNPLGIKDFPDMCGKTAAFVTGSTDETFWTKYAEENCAADQKIDILTFPDRPAALLAVSSDRAAVTAGGAVFAINLLHNWDGIHTGREGMFEVVDTVTYGIANMPASFASPKGDESIRDAVMAAFQVMMDNGDYDTIMDKWYYPKDWRWTSPKLNSATE